MTSPFNESDLELLFQKHGHEPLIHLVRRLVVAIDQTSIGSEERNKTIQLLKHITQQDNIQSNSSSWLDYLESVEEDELSWDQLKRAPTSSKRRVVEMEEETDPSEKPRIGPMTKEQMIWAKALDRHESQGGFGKVLLLLVGLAIIGFMGFALIRYLPDFQINLPSFTSKSQPTPSKITPQDVWSNYQTQLFDADFFDVEGYKKLPQYFEIIDGSNLPPLIQQWWSSQKVQPSISNKNLNSIYWLGLRELESRFFGTMDHRNDSTLWNSLPSGFRRWDFSRNAKGKVLYKGSFVENFTRTEKGWDLQIKRIIGNHGIAHRVIIDHKGLLAWSWRLKWQEHLLEGKLLRSQDGAYKITTSKAWPEEVEFVLQAEDLHYAPAIWSPNLRHLQFDALIFPLSGQLCKGAIFWNDTQVYPNGQGFQLKSQREGWTENWVRIP